MLARLFVIVGGLIVLALTAALVGPYFVDWTSYRADFEREASNILGRKVTVEGAAQARLLPFPSVTFSDVSVAGGADGAPAMTVETFSMDAELAPFMRGEILIFDMRLVRPKATISVDKDGVVDWAVRPSAPYDPAQIALEKLTITEGQVTIRHGAGGRDHVLSEINSEVSARSLAGPWRASGSLRIDGMRTSLVVSTGKVDAAGAMRLRITGEPELFPLGVEADGNVRLKDGAALYAGLFKINARSISTDDLRGIGGLPIKSKPANADTREAPPYRLSGKFRLDHKSLNFDEVRFETGPRDNPYTADGSAFIDLGVEPHFSITADGAQVRFDETAPDSAATGGLAIEDRIDTLRRILSGLPRPTIPGTVDINLPAVVAGDTTIRNVALSAEPAPRGWTLNSMSATLPGRTTLEASGLMRTEGDFGFQGSLLVAVGQPSGFAAWLSRDVDDAIRRLPSAGFNADVDLTRTRQSFRNLELILGEAKFRGRIDRREPDDAEPSMALTLDGDALDVEGMAAFASLFVSDTGTMRLAKQNVDLAVKAGPVRAAGLVAQSIDTSLRVRGGNLEIDRLSIGGLEGATISATGTVRDIATRPSGAVDASIVAVDLAPLISVLAERYPGNSVIEALRERSAVYPDLLQDARIDLVATEEPNDDGTSGVAVSANGKAGGSVFTLTGAASGTPLADATSPMSLSFSARNENSEALMALFGLPALPLGLTSAGETTFSAKGTLADGFEASLDFTANDLTWSYKGSLREAADGLEGEGRVKLEAADIEPWLMTGGVALPGMGLGTQVALASDISYGKRLLTLSKISGTIDEGVVEGDLNAELIDGVPHLTGDLAVDSLDLWSLAAMILGEDALEGSETGWSSTPFRSRMAAPLTADLDISAGSVSAGLFGTAENLLMTARLTNEGVRFSNLTAKAYGGTLRGLAELKNSAGTALLSAQMELAGADLGAVLDGTGVAGRGDISANLTSSGKSAEGLMAALSGSGTATFGAISIPGLNPNGFATILARADAFGPDINASKTAQFAPGIVGSGTFSAASGEIAFTVAGGVLRAPPLTLASPGATLTANIKADAANRTVSVDGEFAYAAGDESLVGSAPLVRYSLAGPLEATNVRFDTEPLAQFLSQRALEIEQARVEAMQSALLEKQRLRREVRYYAALQTERDRAAELRRKAQELRRQKAQEEAAARAQADAEARAAEEEAARQEAEDALRHAQEGKTERPDGAIERAPLPPPDRGAGAPPADGASESDKRRFDPNSIESFLRSLRETE